MMSQTDNNSTPSSVGLWELVRYFLRLGSLGFGGPIALAGYMQRDLVPRRWITTEEYKEGLAFAQMMPGPLAAQLAMWIGYIRHGVLGASLVGIVFILPTYLIVLVISILYVAYNGLSLVQALFYGIGPAVIAIIALSALRLARKTVGKERIMLIIFGAVALITIFLRAEIAILFVIAGLIRLLLYSPPKTWKTPAKIVPAVWLLPGLAGTTATLPLLLGLGTFFLI